MSSSRRIGRWPWEKNGVLEKGVGECVGDAQSQGQAWRSLLGGGLCSRWSSPGNRILCNELGGGALSLRLRLFSLQRSFCGQSSSLGTWSKPPVVFPEGKALTELRSWRGFTYLQPCSRKPGHCSLQELQGWPRSGSSASGGCSRPRQTQGQARRQSREGEVNACLSTPRPTTARWGLSH